MKTLIGYCGVDSGQIMITDPCYLSTWKDNEPFGIKEKDEDGNFSYRGACELTTHPTKKGGQFKNKIGAEIGVVSSSGFGDGVYPVYAEIVEIGTKKQSDKRVKSLTIKFFD